jgi:predicted transcriptional regulator
MYSLTLNFNNVELEHALQQIAEKEGKNAPEIILMAVQQFIQQYQATHADFARNHDYHLYGTMK